jgi:hypothetical protein
MPRSKHPIDKWPISCTGWEQTTVSRDCALRGKDSAEAGGHEASSPLIKGNLKHTAHVGVGRPTFRSGWTTSFWPVGLVGSSRLCTDLHERKSKSQLVQCSVGKSEETSSLWLPKWAPCMCTCPPPRWEDTVQAHLHRLAWRGAARAGKAGSDACMLRQSTRSMISSWALWMGHTAVMRCTLIHRPHRNNPSRTLW